MPAPKWLYEASRLQPLPGRTEKPLRLFRALLRECTYLPDPAARFYLKEHIISRYRAYHPKAPSSKEYIRPLLAQRFTHVNRTARKGLTQLRKANAGYFKPLLKVLLMTYGRVGKRRYELLAPLKRDDHVYQKATSDIISHRLDKLGTHPSVVERIPKLSMQLQALLQSQARADPPDMTRAKLRRVELNIPERNIWQRPTPQKRVANAAKQWLGEMLHKALPPLPDAEWLHLQRLACGEIQGKVVPRRSRNPGDQKDELSMQNNLGLGKDLMEELTQGSNRRPVSTSIPHEMTPRFLQRMWLKVFEQCPMMNWNRESASWEIRWGCSPAENSGPNSKWRTNAELMNYFDEDEIEDYPDKPKNHV